MPDAIKKVTDVFKDLTVTSRGLLFKAGQETDFIFDPEIRKKYHLYSIKEHERPYNFFAQKRIELIHVLIIRELMFLGEDTAVL